MQKRVYSSGKGSTLKGKNLLHVGAFIFPFRVCLLNSFLLE